MANRKKPARVTEAAAPRPGVAANDITEMADLLLSAIPELNEAYTRADIELALDDRGWLNTTRNQLVTTELDAQSRLSYVHKSRLYWLRDPLAKQAVRLWTDYAMGTGISYSTTDKAKQAKLDKFMKARKNRRMLSSEGQRKSSKKLLVDGEIFFGVFTEKDGSKTIRTIDPTQVTHFITDPDDSEHILGYRRRIPSIGSTTEKIIFYADWCADDDDRAMAEAQKIETTQVVLEDSVVVYHLPFDALYQRGNGLLSSVVDWSREHRRFMEARVAITQALSKYAHKLTVKGGQAAVDKIKTKLQSTYAASGASTIEKNPQTAPGGTWVQNEALDLQAVPKATGAGDAATDGNQLKLMVSAGTGIMLHYFGDPSTGNLATATAMELPMLKQFESYQELWKDAYKDIFAIVLDEDINDGVDEAAAPPKKKPATPPPADNPTAEDDGEIVVDLPPILADDLQALGAALSGFANLWPEFADEDEILTMVLTAMRINNVDAVLKNMRQLRDTRKAENDQKQKDLAKLMGGATPKNPAQAALDSARMSSQESDLLASALLRVAEALEA